MQSVTLRQNGIRRWVSLVLVCCLLFPSFSPGVMRAADSELAFNEIEQTSVFQEAIVSTSDNTQNLSSLAVSDSVSVTNVIFGNLLDAQLQQSVIQYMQTDPLIPGSTEFSITSENCRDQWCLLSIVALDGPDFDPQHIGSDAAGLILARQDQSKWRVALAGTPLFSEMLQLAPESLISNDAKPYLDPLILPLTPDSIEYKFPWAAGNWQYRQGWHTPSTPSSLDIGTWGDDKRVLSSADGVVNHICRGRLSANVTVVHSDGTTIKYFHIDINQLGNGITEGATVQRGTVLGVLRPGTWSLEDDRTSQGIVCGYTVGQKSYSAHIHWVIPSDRAFTVDGWTIHYPDNNWRKDGYSARGVGSELYSTNIPVGPNPPPPPPPSSACENYWPGNDVRLFDQADCIGELYNWSAKTGLTNLGGRGNDATKSIHVSPGWSIKIYEHYDGQGSSRCITGPMWNLAIDNYDDGSAIVRGGQSTISSIRVYQNDSCRADQPPPPPAGHDAARFQGEEPTDSYVANPGENILKKWRMLNTGNRTWGAGYQLVFLRGDQMGAPATVNVPSTPPGTARDLAVNVKAPTRGGVYRGYWRMRNPQGTFFGPEIWVQFRVPDTAAPTPPPPPSDPAIKLECLDCPATIPPGTTFRPTIRATVNSGELQGVDLRGDMLHNKDGNLFGMSHPFVALPGRTVIRTGQTYDFQFYTDMRAPDQLGTYESKWQVMRNGNYEGEEITIRFTVQAGSSANRPPHRPTLTGPGDWAVFYGNTGINLTAQHNGDPDGDAITHYYFEIFESAQNANSGWISSNSWSPQGLGFNNYQWRAKVRDSHGNESDWSEQTWRFGVLNNDPEIYDFSYQTCRPAWGNAEQYCFCAQTNAGTIRLQVNTATDGSANGRWQVLNELGTPNYNCNTDDDRPPTWTQLEYETGCHLVRLYARRDGGWANAAMSELTICLPEERRPNSPFRDPFHEQHTQPRHRSYVASQDIHFKWLESWRTTSYRLEVSNVADYSTLLIDETFPVGTTSYQHTFDTDYANIYWRVTAIGPHGTNTDSQRFHIDVTPPESAMTALPPVTTDTKFTVNWTGTDARSGLRWYHVQMRDVSRPDSAWEDWLVNTTKTAEMFQGQPGHTYAFRVRAMDNVGNWEAWPDDDYGHTHTLVDPASAPQTAWWDANYAHKRNLVILNNDSHTMPTDFPIHIRFDASTTPSAAEIYHASLAATKGDDVRVIYDNQTELHRFVQRFTAEQIDLWFPLQAALGGGHTNSGDYQLYYGYAGGSSPPSDVSAVFLPKADTNTVLLAHFQEGSGNTVADTSGRSHHGNFSNAGWEDGFLGYAGSFNGTNSEVNFSNHADFNLNAMTLEAWVWIPTDAPGDRHIFNKDTYWVRLTGSYWPYSKIFGIESGNGCPSVQPNTWAHIAVAYNGTNRVRTYVNGQRCSEKVISGFSPSHTTAAFRVGNAYNWPGRHFLGRIQHVRVSNIERTSFPYARITTPPSVEAGIVIAPPSTGAPDLAMLDLTAYPNPDGGLLVVAQVENQGDADTQSNFYTDLYVNHLPTGAGDYTGSLQFWVNMPIEAGAQITLTTLITDLASMGGHMMHALSAPGAEVTATLYAQVDSVGVISETDTANNISPGVEICLASPDAYAGDDDISSAVWLHLGEVQQRNFDRPTERDWVKFTAHGGVTYTLRTFDLGSAADTYLYLYDTDGTTLLAANDDYGGSLASRIDWMAPVTGTYYALVQHWNPNVGGCGTSYALTLEETPAGPTVALSEIAITGPLTGTPGTQHAFEVTVQPVTVTQPIHYTWHAAGHAPESRTGGRSDNIVYSWDTFGYQTITVTATNAGNTVVATHTIKIYNEPGLVLINAINPRPPYCVVRESETPYDRLLELDGENFSLGPRHLNFRRTDTGAVSIHFGMEVNWESDNRVSVDIADIQHLLWEDERVTMTVRFTSEDYRPLSNWSAEFILADDVTACGIARPLAPQAEFTASITEGVAPLTVSFTNLSTGDYDSCVWDFGDDNTSTDCDNPSHEYLSGGIYTVKLTVKGPGGEDNYTCTDCITVTVAYEPSKAEFTASITEGVAPLTVNFTNLSTGDYDTCLWDFGDDNTSTDCDNPSHEYLSGGIYTVKLTVKGPGGEDNYTCTDCITVYTPVDAKFAATPTSGTAPLTVNFTNQSTGDYDTCLWEFGDGDTSTQCNNVQHTYEEIRSYTVKLTINGDGGSDTETKMNYITVTEAHFIFVPLVLKQ